MERAQEIERQQQKAIERAKGLVERAETLWTDLRENGNHHNDDWQLAHLAEIEDLLVDALALDRNAAKATGMLAGIRKLLIETGIKTQDLNLASIYLQKLKTSTDLETTTVIELGKDLEAAWAEADPARSLYVRRLRKWALIGCWLPLVWMGAMLVLSYSASGDHGFTIWASATGGVDTILHYVAALFAVMAAAGDQRRVGWTNAAALLVILVGLLALNLPLIIVAAVLVHCAGKIRMQKLLWPRPIPRNHN